MSPPPLATRLPFLYPPALLRTFTSSSRNATGAAPTPSRVAAAAGAPGASGVAAATPPTHLARIRVLRHHHQNHNNHQHGHHPTAKRAAPQLRRRFSQSTSRCRATFAPRHGKAVEPPPPPSLSDDAKRKEAAAPGGTGIGPGTGTGAGPDVGKGMGRDAGIGSADSTPGSSGGSSNTSSSSQPSGAGESAASSSTAPTTPHAVQETKAGAKMGGPMQAVLYMGPPQNGRQRGFVPSPHVHHFDSYTLVRQLQEGRYSGPQAITAMKAIRALLTENLDVAQGTLVSKIDAENETYLFRAACSELGAEIKNNRRVADENMRQQRILLQHEVDILTQTLNQELLTLNDNVRGMFNDRRMTVREEQRTTEAAIQQLTYKISIGLSSDAKSEIESLRWILIRRSVLGIIFMAVLTLGTLRYATYVSHERQKEAERRRQEKEQKWKHDGMKDQSTAPDAAVILAAS